MVYQHNTQLASIIRENPSILSLFNRLGIYLGVGHATVHHAAVSHGLDPEFLLVMVNTYLNSDYFPEEELKSFPLSGLADYLTRTNRYYCQVQLPNIGRHFHHLVERTFSPDTNLNRLYDYYLKLQAQFSEELQKEISMLEPIGRGEPNAFLPEEAEALRLLASEKPRACSEALNDLINLFIIHLKGTYDSNLCHAVINALIALDNDMRQNFRIHDRILSPLLLKTLSQ